MDPSTTRRNTAPRLEVSVIQGWRAEFRLWWAMTKHVDVVFDKSPASLQHLNLPNATPGSISMCRGCCQIVSTRMCSGKTKETAFGCAFHRKRPDVPIAVRSIITSTRLREMLKPRMIVERYYLRQAPIRTEAERVEHQEEESESESESEDYDADEHEEQEAVSAEDENLVDEFDDDMIRTNLMNIGWVTRIRLGNRETRRSRKLYVHDEEGGCIHSKTPDVVVQGLGPKHLYFKRCDGLFVNAFGEILEKETNNPRRDYLTETERGEAITTLLAETPICEKDPESVTSPHNDDDIRPVSEEEEEEEDDDEFSQVPNPWANVVIDTVVKTEVGSAANGSSNHDSKEDDPGTDTITTPSPLPPCSSSYRRKETSQRHLHRNSVLTIPTSWAPSTSAAAAVPLSSQPPKSFSLQPPLPPLPVNLDVPESELARLAWRRHNIAVARAEDLEEAIEQEVRRRHRVAQKRRWFLLWLR